MAGSRQSALDYILRARVHLVRELKNLSVIVENLYQQQVLTDEEVSRIQEESNDDYTKTRTILDMVVKKGEAACYEFLRIIDVTRKTLVRPSPSGPSTETMAFDLNHWISWFSFEEDTQMFVSTSQGSKPCYRYQAKLKSHAARISKEFWMANRYLFDESYKADLSYTPLVLDSEGIVSPSKIKKLKSMKSKMSRPKKLRAYIPEAKTEISPHDLLKVGRDIVVVGNAGMGKTALSLQMLNLWAESDGEEVNYTFYFDMRENNNFMMTVTLEELLFGLYSEPDEGTQEVIEDIQRNSEAVMIIFDGVTDLSSHLVRRLVEKDLLPDAKIIITCRPEDEEDVGSGDFFRVEVKGFSEWSIKTYLSATLGEQQSKVSNNLELLTLCYVPMYAVMVAACFSSEDTPQLSTMTDVYITIVRFCLQKNIDENKKRDLDSYINSKRVEILSLAEVAFNATQGKTVNLTEPFDEDSAVLSFLKLLNIRLSPTESRTMYAFFHYTMQEFFAAVWLLKNPDKVKDVLQQCLTEQMKHMKHLIPFMCKLLNERNPTLMKWLVPAEELKSTSDWFFKEVISTFLALHETDEDDIEDSPEDVDILFLCRCLYESQCPEACIYLLEKLDYYLDVGGQSLDPYSCCAVAYVVSQSKERKIHLNLADVMVSEQGMRSLFGCLKNVQWCDPLPRQLWKIFLLSEGQMDHISLLGLDGNRLHLPIEGKSKLFERAASIMQEITSKVTVCLYWDRPAPACQSLFKFLFQALPHISSVTFVRQPSDPIEETRFFGNLFFAAAERQQQTGEKILEPLLLACRYKTFPLEVKWCDFLLDLCSDDTGKGRSAPLAQFSIFQPTPAVWFIDLSERNPQILLQVLQLQPVQKHVVLTGWSHEGSEVGILLDCLPYISQLSFQFSGSELPKFFGDLFCAAAEREQQTGEKVLEVLSSVCRYKTFPFYDRNMDNDRMRDNQWYFLIHLFYHLECYETETGLSVLPALHHLLSPQLKHLAERNLKEMKLPEGSYEGSKLMSFLNSPSSISQLGAHNRVIKAFADTTTGDCDVKIEPTTVDMMLDVPEDDTKLGQVRGNPRLSESQPPSSFTPELQTESTQFSYRFRCPSPGGFQCALTGLVFVVVQEVELHYRIAQWDESLLQSAGKIAAGPLFDISCHRGAVSQLHLPHCEAASALLSEGLLSVIHISDEGTSFLKPQEITDTHVIVNVPHFSRVGLVWPFDIIWRLWNNRKVIRSQILLFLRPPNPKTQRQSLNVFLLPRNVPLEEVSVKQRNSVYIEAPSKCKLIKDQCYTVHCTQAYKIQPNRAEFDLDFGPNYHPTFEIRLPLNTEETMITVRDQTLAVWECEVDLTGPRRETGQRIVPAENSIAAENSITVENSIPAEDNLPAEDKLLLARREFIPRVSEPVLDQLLDKLFECGVINDDEMQSLSPKIKTERARDMIDIVRRKGTDASLILIAALREGDPCLSRELKLC